MDGIVAFAAPLHDLDDVVHRCALAPRIHAATCGAVLLRLQLLVVPCLALAGPRGAVLLRLQLLVVPCCRACDSSQCRRRSSIIL